MKAILINLLLILLFSLPLSAAIDIQYRNYDAHGGDKGEPVVECDILAKSNDIPIVLSEKNTQLTESDVAVVPHITFGTPDGSGWQHIRFSPIIAIPHQPLFKLVVTYGTEVETRTLPPFNWNGYDIVLFRVDNGNIVNELNFTDGEANEQVASFYFIVRGSYSTPTEFAQAPWVDSITFTHPSFTYTWTGLPNYDQSGIPPKQVRLDCRYLITVVYKTQQDNPFLKEFMTFHLGGDIQFKIPITTNTYNLDAVPLLKLLAPIGNEKLAPCEEFLIRWEGQSKEHQILLQYSTEGKQNWQDIATVDGNLSSYLWTVPSAISNNCYVRISQAYSQNKNQSVHIEEDSSAMLSAIFNNDATRAITTSSDNNIVEWNLYPLPTPITKTQVTSSNAQLTSACYLNDNKRYIALDEANKRLLYINSGTSSISKTQALPADFYPNKLLIDKDRRYICITPISYGNRLLFVDTSGNNPIYYTENMPITNAYISENDNATYITLLDNTIKVLDMSGYPNIKIKEILDYAKNWNIIETISVSQDLRLVGISIRKTPILGDATPFTADNLIYDRQNNIFFKNLNVKAANALDLVFNPTGRLAILSHSYNPQIAIMDLTDDASYKQTLLNYVVPILYGVTVAKTGNSMLVRSIGDTNCVLLNFSLPESTTNAKPFAIIRPALEFTAIDETLKQLIGTTVDYVFKAKLCNKSDVVAIFDNAYFDKNIHFKFSWAKNQIPLVLNPGECKDLTITVTPLDTGKLSDELRLVACNFIYKFNFSVQSLNRKLPILVNQPFDFGEQCLYVDRAERLVLFKNNDSVPVIVNRCRFKIGTNFNIVHYPQDTILQPNESYVVTIGFSPIEMGIVTDTLVVYHSGQDNVTLSVVMVGRGIGTLLETSHSILPFIPDIKQRTLSITNTGDANLYVESVEIIPAGLYKCNTPLPLYILSNATQEIEIEYLGDVIGEASVRIIAKPCAMNRDIYLMPYTGSAALTIPQIEVNPTDMDAIIPIMMSNTEIYAYRGERSFEVEITLNQHIYYPLYAITQFGKAEIIRNEVIGDLRYIGVRAVGDFNSKDAELVAIYGVAAIYETDTSDISFVSTSKFFGQSVQTTYKNGKLRITNLAPNRHIIYKPNLTIQNSFPNPVSDVTTIHYDISAEIIGSVRLEVIDITGASVIPPIELNGAVGSHTQHIDLTTLASGEYKIVINYGEGFTTYKLIKKE